jgi:hypothetical protein
MAAAARKTAEPTPAEVLAELDHRVVELEARDRALLAEQLKLEADKVAPVAPGTSRAPAVLDPASYLESGKIEERAGDPGVRLFEIIRERQIIRQAVDLAGKRQFRLRVAAEAELAGDIHTRWRENISKTAACVRLMRSLADERARLRSEYASRTGLALMGPCGQHADRVVGQYLQADAAQEFLDAAARANIE